VRFSTIFGNCTAYLGKRCLVALLLERYIKIVIFEVIFHARQKRTSSTFAKHIRESLLKYSQNELQQTAIRTSAAKNCTFLQYYKSIFIRKKQNNIYN